MRIRSALAATFLAATAVMGAAGAASAADPDPIGVTGNSPGVLSGDNIQIPVDVDLPICGNTIDIIGLLNPDSGNTCKTN
ncbi:chaplin [Streptomyces sp. NPDC006711]|uniref:chaplin n=1 Tax=unclassified Streptomyces TaxID=2593676 RepID=UPI003305BA42